VFLQRATGALNTVLTHRREQRLIVVADAAVVEAAHVLLLGLQPEARLGLGFVTDPASVTRWCRHVNNYGRTVWMLIAHNDTRHLTEEPQ
jgi:probable phosphoglycerate mutase